MGANLQSAQSAIERFSARTGALITLSDRKGRAAARDLLRLLGRADRSIDRRLRRWNARNGGGSVRFSEASLIAYRQQLQQITEIVQLRLRGLTTEQAMRAARFSLSRTRRLLVSLERSFTGIVVPVRLDEAVVSLLRPSLLDRHATSVDRYGSAMIRRMNVELAQGFAEGISQREMVDRLVGLRGPRGAVSLRAVEIQPGMVVRLAEELIAEGLFVRYRSWAWRIVRTEVAEAQNAVALEGMMDWRDKDFPDLQKKILAILDDRTADDSLGVHGQIRDLDKTFMDGAGRVYLRPPSRPNDREYLIPWRPHWSEVSASRQV